MGCAGSGNGTCLMCGGAGQLKHFQLLTVQFRCPKLTDVLDSTDVPDKLIGKAKGEVVVSEREECVAEGERLEAAIDARINALLKSSHSVPQRLVTVLFQNLHVEKVGIYEVLYRYKQRASQRLLVYGEQNFVYAPKVPKDALNVGLVVTFLSMVVGWMVYILLNSQAGR